MIKSLSKFERKVVGRIANAYLALENSKAIRAFVKWNEADRRYYEQVFGPPVNKDK